MKTRIATLLTIGGLALTTAPAALAHHETKRHHRGSTAACKLHRHHRAHGQRGCITHGRISPRAHIAGAPTTHHPRGHLVAAPSTPASPAVHCDLFSSPTGSDGSGDGSLGRPFASLSKLDAALAPGQTGCLRGGSYGSTSTWHQINHNGTATGRITLTAYPGETATVTGYIEVDAAYTTISHLKIDGSNSFYKQHPAGVDCSGDASDPLTIVGHDDILEYDEYYQSNPSLRGNGIGVGFWGNADNTIIRYNRIHDVGSCMAYDHLIYLSHGNNVRIYDNWMWNDPHGRGIQLYPDPTNARIWGNVIDHTGVGFGIGDEAGDSPAGNEIFNNVVTNSVGLPWENLGGQAINVYWGGKPAPGNSFNSNDAYGNPDGVGYTPNIATQGNVSVAPVFANAAVHNYAPTTGSPVASWKLWNGR